MVIKNKLQNQHKKKNDDQKWMFLLTYIFK